MVTLTLLKALREKNLDYETIDAFDLTLAMLPRFHTDLQTRGISRVQLKQADVLNLEALPRSWTNYDLIISASMLEYHPKQELHRALAGLHARLAPDGHILVIIMRKTPETKVFIEWWWHAERYTKKELLQAVGEAGFRNPNFCRFPRRYFWRNRANYIVVARA
jgi:cyclopropane fatty-acyl-phospholipid synthase-like methyltransferase